LKIETCEFPDSLLYDADAQTWAKRKDGEYTVGITPVLAWLSGGFTSISIRSAGSTVEVGKGIGSVEGPRHFDLVRAPFDCVIKEINPKLAKEPHLANTDPFGAGWVAVLGQKGASSKLSTISEAAGSIGAFIRRLGVRCFSRFPDMEMFEIGTECSAVIVKLNEAMGKSGAGTVIHLVSDDPTSDIEIARWEDESRNRVVESRREGSLYHFILEKS
jgi:glycine cleavage system H protein